MSEIVAAPPEPSTPSTRSYRWVAAPVLAFALVALTAGLLAKHEPRSKGYFRLFFSDPLHLKAGFATAAVVLGVFQLFTAAWIFRKLPWRKPSWVNPAHRWSGRPASRPSRRRRWPPPERPCSSRQAAGRATLSPPPGRAESSARTSTTCGLRSPTCGRR